MTVLDIGVIVILIGFIVRGVWIGFVRQLAFVLALVFGYLAAGRYYPVFSQYTSAWLKDPQLRFVVTYTVLFLLTYVAVMLLGLGLKKVMQVTFLGWFDRTMGAVFGLAKAVFLATLIFMGLAGIFSTTNPIIHKSLCSPYLMMSSNYMTSFIQDKELKKELVPKKPAISSFLSDPVTVLKTLRGGSE
nr:CvpA family protein [Desulfobulbaceae bacterium]